MLTLLGPSASEGMLSASPSHGLTLTHLCPFFRRYVGSFSSGGLMLNLSYPSASGCVLSFCPSHSSLILTLLCLRTSEGMLPVSSSCTLKLTLTSFCFRRYVVPVVALYADHFASASGSMLSVSPSHDGH